MKVKTTYRLEGCCAVVAILALAGALLATGAAAGNVGIIRGLLAARHGCRYGVEVVVVVWCCVRLT